MTVFGTSFVSVRELGVVDAVALVAIGLLHELICLLLSKVHDVLNDLRLLNGFQELVAEHWFAAKLAGLGRELLLGLGCESRVDNLTVDEQEEMVLDLSRLQFDCSFVLLVDNSHELVDNLVCNVVDVCTTGSRRDRVDERHLIERSIGNCETNVPAIVLVGDDDLLAVLVLNLALLSRDGFRVHFHVFCEAGDLDTVAVEVDFDATKCTSHIVGPALDQRLEVVVNTIHAKLAEISLPGDFCVVVSFDVGDLGLAHLAHIFCPCLLVLLLLLGIHSFD
jgi:hypothetical protein